jgi:hypothetical protein
MRWKSVALAGAAWPALAGCNIAHYAARNLANEPKVVLTQAAIEHDLRKQARAAWQEVRGEYPRCAFTAEFRDGFIDGYVDYLDRGGNGSLPAVPPAKYTRHKKYYTEDGQCRVKDYFLGFKYGQEIAIATGKRQFLTVPVLLPQQPAGPPPFTVAPPAVPVLVLPPGAPPMIPPAPPGGVLPPPNPLPGSDTPPSKFDPPGLPPTPEPLPAPKPPLPVPPGPGVGAGENPPPVVEVPAVAVPIAPVSLPRLPAPPPEVPLLPDHVPTPSVLDELPVVLPSHEAPPPVLPTHPEPQQTGN